MIKLKDIKNQKINDIKVVEILFYLFPLSFILGNLIINLHLLIFIVFSFFLINKKGLNTRFEYYYWILISFFLYFFLLTTFQFHYPEFINEKINYYVEEQFAIGWFYFKVPHHLLGRLFRFTSHKSSLTH